MKFYVTIEESTSKQFEIHAKSLEQAMEIAEIKYKVDELVLDPGNLVCKQMCAENSDGSEGTEWMEF